LATLQIIVNGSITVGPQGATSTYGGVIPVPAETRQIYESTSPSPKPSAKQGGGSRFNQSALGTFIPITGLGTNDNVTTCDFLYIKTDAPAQLQLTMQNLQGGSSVVSVVNIVGEQKYEFPPSGYLTGLAIAGSCNYEAFISGPA
jgi:hypothetical protein